MHRLLQQPVAAVNALRAALALDPCDTALIDRLLSLDPAGADRAALLARRRLLVPEEPPAEAVRKAGRQYQRNSEGFAKVFPSAGPRWGEYARRMRDFIARNSSAAAAAHFAQSQVDFESREACTDANFALVQGMRGLLAEDFPDARDVLPWFSDSPLALPQTVRRDGNLLVSKYLYYFARRVLKAASLIGRLEVVCDIGAGTGLAGRLWFMSGRLAPRTYIIVDLPETLYFSQLYLMAHVGEDQVGMVQDDGLAPHRGKKVILVPIDRIECLYEMPIDLVTNFGSLQEMSEYWVDFYHRLLDRIDARYFYSCNYFAQPAQLLAESANLWAPRLGGRWRTFSAEINPWAIRMLSPRNHLEWIVKRQDHPLRDDYLADHFDELLRHRALDARNLFELMDVFRLTRSLAHAAQIVEKYRSADYKEVLFLAQWLSGEGAGCPAELREAVDDVRCRLASLRQGGIEAVVWPPAA
jgi:putative sugar O-methyltransferase